MRTCDVSRHRCRVPGHRCIFSGLEWSAFDSAGLLIAGGSDSHGTRSGPRRCHGGDASAPVNLGRRLITSQWRKTRQVVVRQTSETSRRAESAAVQGTRCVSQMWSISRRGDLTPDRRHGIASAQAICPSTQAISSCRGTDPGSARKRHSREPAPVRPQNLSMSSARREVMY